MTTLEKIVKKAQALKKSYPNKFAKWTDYVKEASKEFKKLPDQIKKKTKLGSTKTQIKKKSKIDYTILLGQIISNKNNVWNIYQKDITKKINQYITFDWYIKRKKDNLLLTNQNLPKEVNLDTFILNKDLITNLINQKETLNNMNGTKKTKKKKSVYKDNVKNVSNLIKKKIKSKKLIMPHGYQVSKSKLNGNSIGSINEKYITELNNINREIENAKQNINSLKTLKLNDLKNFKLGFKQELLDRYINRTKYLKKQLIQIKKQIK